MGTYINWNNNNNIHINEVTTMEFLFKDEVIKFLNRPEIAKYKFEIGYLKGISCPALSTTFINLSATQWVVFYYTDESLLITELCKTVVHENIHDLIGTVSYEEADYSPIGEEAVVDILSGQTPKNSGFSEGMKYVPV